MTERLREAELWKCGENNPSHLSGAYEVYIYLRDVRSGKVKTFLLD